MEAKEQGNKLYSQGKKREAIKAYTKGIDLVEADEGTEADNGVLHILYCNRSRVSLELCQVDEALQDAELAIEANPEYGRAYARRANVLLDLFEFKGALEDLDKAEELDPTLKGGLDDERLRATGKKWVPNCHLQKQLDLRNKIKCHYVLILEAEDGEVIEEPVWLSKEFLVLCPGGFKEANASGTGTEGLMTGFMAQETKTGKRFHEKDAMEEYYAMVKAQLQLQYGPDKEYKSKTHIMATNTTALTAALTDYFVFHAHQAVGTAAETRGGFQAALTPPTNIRIFFPGAPRWVDLDPTEFAVGTGNPEMTAETPEMQSKMKEYRKRFEGRELKCIGCGTRQGIDPEDPQECVCGEIFCSYFCHENNWKKHKDACGAATSKIVPLCAATLLYWRHVCRGRFPCKQEPDFMALWRERGITQENCGEGKEIFNVERDFHYDHEQELFRRDSSLFLMDEKMDHYEHRVHEHVGKWTLRMGNMHPSDSVPRLLAKLDMCINIRQQLVAGDGEGTLVPELYPRSVPELAQVFKNHILTHCADHHGADQVLKKLDRYITGVDVVPGTTFPANRR